MADYTPFTSEELDAIEARRQIAHEMINALCNRRREWIMSIPARPDHDPDLVIGASLRDNIRLIADVRYWRVLYETLAEHHLAGFEALTQELDELRLQRQRMRSCSIDILEHRLVAPALVDPELGSAPGSLWTLLNRLKAAVEGRDG